ncbi:MAG: BatA domain-containing protein, partial [Planctomycetes bacterium]|nr:BatA domain-containing protein [Planctomycetota bacterium]
MNLLAFSLINAGFLPYFGLASIPVIIYLINRQRYRRVRWAAMEFLLRAMKKNRKRLRLENLLLLIVRTLIVLLFILGMLRPVLDTGALPIAAGSARAELYVVDASYSMGLEDGGRSLLDQALDAIRRRLDKSLSPGDQVGLVVGGGFPESMFREPQTVSEQGIRVVQDTLDRVELIYEQMDINATLSLVASWIEQSGHDIPWEIHVFTDVQRRDWLTEDGAVEIGIRDALTRIDQQGSKIVVHALGPPRVRNATVTALDALSTLIAIDMPTSFQATVLNSGRETLAGLEVELSIDGEVQASKTINLEPNTSQIVAFPYVFREVG